MDKHHKRWGKTRRKRSQFSWSNRTPCSIAGRNYFWGFCTIVFVGFLPSLPSRKKETNKQKRHFEYV